MTTISLVDCEPRWATRRSERESYGPQAARYADELGIELMPWQRQVLDVALEHDEAGRLMYREVGLTVPRQSGKTTLLLVLFLWRCLHWDAQVTVYTAQTGADARAKWFDDWLPLLEHSPFRRYFKPRKATGSEALVFTNGSRQHLIATSDSSGHGKSVDLAILDEVFAYPDARLEQAMKPAMITRDSPQLWVVSTAGVPGQSPYLWGKVERGRLAVEAGSTSGMCYFEWSADEKADPANPATWWSCMPALGHTVSEEAVAADFASMARPEFRRAYLNQWVTGSSDPVIDLDDWNRLTVTERTDGWLVTALAFDVTPDRARSSIAAVIQRPDGLPHVEVVANHSGTGWVAEQLASLKAKHRPWALLCDPSGPAGSLLPDMEKHGLELELVGAADHAKACGLLFDAVAAKEVRHNDDPLLLSALDGACKRPLGDAWAWSRKSSSVDISPLVAVTLALWGHSQHRPKPAKTRFFTLNDVLPEEG